MTNIIEDKDLQKKLVDKVNDSIIDQLRDIEGLDSVSWWPLAPIWWFFIFVILALLAFAIYKYYKRRKWLASWQYKYLKKLSDMENTLNENNAIDFLVELSTIIRRIAMHYKGRKECASLIGKKWLKYLSDNDPEKFDWVKNGGLLTVSSYAPKNTKIKPEEVKSIIKAIKCWIK